MGLLGQRRHAIAQRLTVMEAQANCGDEGEGLVSQPGLAQAPPDFALLDLNLGPNETSLAVAERLTALGIPFLSAAGYGDALHFPPDLAGVPVAHKPYTVHSVEAALAATIAARE